jgi:hypothetical protein
MLAPLYVSGLQIKPATLGAVHAHYNRITIRENVADTRLYSKTQMLRKVKSFEVTRTLHTDNLLYA